MISLIISVISCMIALGSMVFSIYKFASYDKQIASLDTTIKAHQVKRIKEEEQLLKRAHVEANPYSNKAGAIKVKFYNRGKATARNVNFETIDDTTLHVSCADSLLPYPLLNPQDGFEAVVHYWGEKTVCQIKITWEDECGEQEYVQALQLY